MKRVAADDLLDAASELLVETGAPADIADAVAESLVEADLAGHDSHGVIRIPTYAEMIDDGVLDPGARPTVERHTSATAVVDGRCGFGHVAGRTAVSALTERAHDVGVAAVGVRDATHIGRIGEWATRVTEEGLLFAALVSDQGGSRIVAPAGSAEGRFSTNPIAFGVPTFDALPFPIVLDMATSQVAHGKILERAINGESLPEGWAVSAEGAPLTDPELFEAGEGAILPLGGETSGYKGFGLSVMAILFSGILSDGLVNGQADLEWFNNAAAFFAIDPLRFTDAEGVIDRVAALAEYLQATAFDEDVSVGPGASGEETLLPGEVEYLTARERRNGGIPLDERTIDHLREFAAATDAPNVVDRWD